MILRYYKALRDYLRVPSRAFRIKGRLFSLFFGVIVVSVFYLLQAIIPDNFERHEEIETFLFIVISVLLLFPARIKIARIFLHKRDYNLFFGENYHHLDFIARQFTMETLIHEITPELMDWLGVRSGTIALLEPDRRRFIRHTVQNGQIRQGRTIEYTEIENGKKYLKEQRRASHYTDLNTPRPLARMMEEYNAMVIQPFVYRNRLLGFLLLNEEPKTPYAAIALETFAGKAAVSIQNYILSSKVIDSKQFEQEFEEAAKIQHLLQLTRLPELPGYNIKLLKPDTFPCILELFRSREGKWFMAVLCSPRLSGAAGIFLFGILGRLYSFIHRKANITMYGLMDHLKKDPALMRSEYRMEILVAEIQPGAGKMLVLEDGKNYRIREQKNPEKTLISPGWRNFLDIHSENPLQISYAGEVLLEISSESVGTAEEDIASNNENENAPENPRVKPNQKSERPAKKTGGFWPQKPLRKIK